MVYDLTHFTTELGKHFVFNPFFPLNCQFEVWLVWVGFDALISAIDPNGNSVILGQTTTDSSGLYSIVINTSTLTAGPGKCKVTATFAGSNSHWQSSVESTFKSALRHHHPHQQPTSVTGLGSTDTVELGFVAVIIVIIIIGAILAILTLRKRP